MPIGIQRLNAKRSQPNERIVFIQPLPGPSEKVALDFLERIAAQCLPIMRDHHLSVMSLEEYEPNPEFVGRNFNAGEVIQLVLKSRSGRWLPFEYVQMVMMHELAHCKQMNHSKSFWAVRNQYAEQLRSLWSKGYTGDGIWGRGTLLDTGEFQTNSVLPSDPLPQHLCGGTYRSRGRKRKAKPKLSYKEQKERRILKKFGANGTALGADDDIKVKLEKGKKTQAKPRVAGSARGRELRAAAALARFEVSKVEDKEPDIKDESGDSDDSYDNYDDSLADTKTEDALGPDGKKLLDAKGRGLVKVCEDENLDDHDAQQELQELQNVNQWRQKYLQTDGKSHEERPSSSSTKPHAPSRSRPQPSQIGPPTITIKAEEGDDSVDSMSTIPREHTGAQQNRQHSPQLGLADRNSETCSICSFSNPTMSVTCAMCSNVLDPDSMPNAWRCESSPCKDTLYVNPGDYGVCGVCGQTRPG